MSENDLFLIRRYKDFSVKKYISKQISYDISPIVKLCPDQFNVLNHKLLLMKQIGSGSEYGEAFKSCAPYDTNLNKCDPQKEIILSTKKIPLSRKQQKDIQQSIDTDKNKLNGLEPYEYNDVSMEILGMYLSYVITMNNTPICPNLPLMYDWFYCDNISYSNDKLNTKVDIDNEYPTLLRYLNTNELNKSYKSFITDLQKADKIVNVADSDINKFLTTNQLLSNTIRSCLNNQITNSCLLVLNEYADEGDLKSWLLKKKRSGLEWYTMYFQVFAGLYALQKHFDLLHYDLHWGNVLVHNINNFKKFDPSKKDDFILYNINDKYYKIPNTGFLFTLWDYGFARIFSKNLHAKTSYPRDNLDMNPYSEDYYRISHAIYWYQGGNSPNEPTGKETNREIHGVTPDILKNAFYKEMLKAYKKNTPLEKVIPILFSRFMINKDEYDELKETSFAPYIINDNNTPSVPPEIKNTTTYYKDYLNITQLRDLLNQPLDRMQEDTSMNNSDAFMQTS